MVEPAKRLHRFFQRILTRMTEGRMANIVGQTQGLGQILIQAQRAGDRPANLSDLKTMCQTDPKMVAIGGNKNLRLVAQAAERDGVNDTVAVALENITWSAHIA
jgi:hypothetical protein